MHTPPHLREVELCVEERLNITIIRARSIPHTARRPMRRVRPTGALHIAMGAAAILRVPHLTAHTDVGCDEVGAAHAWSAAAGFRWGYCCGGGGCMGKVQGSKVCVGNRWVGCEWDMARWYWGVGAGAVTDAGVTRTRTGSAT